MGLIAGIRAIRLEYARDRLADLNHDARKWGFADRPSEARRRYSQIERVERRVKKLEAKLGVSADG